MSLSLEVEQLRFLNLLNLRSQFQRILETPTIIGIKEELDNVEEQISAMGRDLPKIMVDQCYHVYTHFIEKPHPTNWRPRRRSAE